MTNTPKTAVVKDCQIIQVSPTPELIITPCNFLFPPEYNTKWGCLADDGIQKTYVYPVCVDDFAENPLEFVMAASLEGIKDFHGMVRNAYEKRWNLRVGETLVLWSEYEELFKNHWAYRQRPPAARIINLGKVKQG